jgi:hypothetical protein
LVKNTRAAKLFDVKVTKTDTGAARIEWSKIEAHRDWATLSAGCYLLRTNVADWSDEDLWKAYIQLTEAEAAFRIHKSDLSLRPIWHQKEERVLAHIFVCFVAYVLWKTLGQICIKKRVSATNPAECWPNCPTSAPWTSCCQLGPVRRSGPAASQNRPTTSRSFSKNSASNCPPK